MEKEDMKKHIEKLFKIDKEEVEVFWNNIQFCIHQNPKAKALVIFFHDPTKNKVSVVHYPVSITKKFAEHMLWMAIKKMPNCMYLIKPFKDVSIKSGTDIELPIELLNGKS